MGLRAFAEEHEGLYTIASHVEITQTFCEEAKSMLYSAYSSHSNM